ncbi:MAG TPA: BrnT family toxin [Rhodospirillaceae bacterium]|nr:BrnT family toxin [Rhodospirillaceae bacterium]
MFEWDDEKNEDNLRERGFDFAHAARIFEAPVLEMDDTRTDYGERRIQAIGRVGADILFVVYTWRREVRRIISARRANRKERDVYGKVFGGSNPH